jgi:hypothetical protein
MRRLSLRLGVGLVGVALLLTGVISYAQGTPPTTLINAALADMSTRVGTTLTLNDLASWRWTQSNYPDTSLSCPQAGQTYSQVLTNGYQLLFIYNGGTYDYRASADGQILFLCSGPASAPSVVPTTSAATAIPAQAVPTQSTGRAVCTGAMNTRLNVGMEARVRQSGLAVNVRGTPTSTGVKVALMAPGDTFQVVGGPQCGESIVWWQVLYGEVTGWAGEGANGLYWVEPTGTTVTTSATPAATTSAPPAPQAAQIYSPITESQAAITAQTATQLDRLVELPVGEAVTSVAWSGQTLAVTSTSGLNLYSSAAFTLAPRFFQVPNGPTTDAAFSPDGTLLATAHHDTTVRLWDLSVGGLRAVLRGHTQPVWAVVFSPDGQMIASTSGSADAPGDNVIRLWEVSSRGQLAVLAGHTGPVTAVAFSPDGTLIASGGEDNTVRLWDVASASPGTVLPDQAKPVRAVAFSPDGTWLASAGDGAVIQLWEVGPGTQIALESPSPVTALVFSADGSLLVSAGRALDGSGDSAVRVWDVATRTLIATLETYDAAPDAVVTALAFNADGTLLAESLSQGSSSQVRIFGVKP